MGEKLMKKLLAFGLSVFMGLAMLLAGCSSNSESSGSAKNSSKDLQKVVFWTHYTDDLKFTEQAVADYNKANAGKVEVELKNVSNDTYNNVLLLSLKNNTNAPDIFADGISLPQLVGQNYVAPLDDLMSSDMKNRVQNFKAMGANWMEGKWYSLPMRGYNFRLVYNKDMFKAAGLDPNSPPKTFAEMSKYAKKLTNPDKKQYGFMLPTGESWIWWIYANQPSYASGHSHLDWKTLKYDFSSAKSTLETYLQMKKDGSLYPGGTSMKNDPARAQFSAGSVGMMFAASWDVGVLNDQFPAKNDWGVAPLPSETGTPQGKTEFNFGSYLMINNNSKVKQAAMDFYEYLLSPDVLKKYYEEGFGIPVYPGITDDATTPSKKGAAGFADISGDSLYPMEPPTQVEGKGCGDVYNDIMNGTVSVDTGLADLTKRYNAAVEKGISSKAFNPDDYKQPNFSLQDPTAK
jgi:multiple sugar transport system substrate-binding protein